MESAVERVVLAGTRDVRVRVTTLTSGADPTLAAQSELMADFANVWRAADKFVYSTALPAASTDQHAWSAASTPLRFVT